MLDEKSPLCGDMGRCYLAAGHYPITVHEDNTSWWTYKPGADPARRPEAVTPFHVKHRTSARHRA